MAQPLEVLDRLCENAQARTARQRLLIVAAHPDDEILGAGGLLCAVGPEVDVALVSDGAPRNPRAHRDAGLPNREALACVRRLEMLEALALAGVEAGRVHQLGAVDQEVSLQIPRLTGALVALILGIAPDIVISHAYEGGHPDHDATALALHAAFLLAQRAGRATPPLLEFTSYHERDGELVTGQFIPAPNGHERALELDATTRRRKAAMLSCHRSQERMLRMFPIDVERFRVAPRYDFSGPPARDLYYERFDWGMTGERFGCIARAALNALRITGPC